MLNGGTDRRDMLSVITQPLQIPNLPAINVMLNTIKAQMK